MDLPSGLGVALGFLIGIPLHQFATHRLAVKLGDNTPRLMRRNTLSLAAHADPLGTYIIPAVWVFAVVFAGFQYPPFGWGKRHSINRRAFRHPKRDAILVALVGPAVTAVVAIAAGAAVKSLQNGVAIRVVAGIALVNVALTVFELLPIPGRDGGTVLCRFLSPVAAMKFEEMEQYDVLFLLVLYMFLGFAARGVFQTGCRALTPLCS